MQNYIPPAHFMLAYQNQASQCHTVEIADPKSVGGERTSGDTDRMGRHSRRLTPYSQL
jgi:hypothetical protein